MCVCPNFKLFGGPFILQFYFSSLELSSHLQSGIVLPTEHQADRKIFCLRLTIGKSAFRLEYDNAKQLIVAVAANRYLRG